MSKEERKKQLEQQADKKEKDSRIQVFLPTIASVCLFDQFMDPGQQGLKTTELDFIARGQEFEMSGYDYTPDLHNLFKTEDGHEDQIRALEAENQVGYVWNQKVVSLDCEMVQTGETNTDLSLARVTILDQDGQTIFDELCKPGKPVVDYLTQYSGITEGMLDDQ